MPKNNKKTKNKMNLLEIEAKGMLNVSRALASEQRKKILNAVINSDKPLTITEVQMSGQIPNYKNTHANIQLLEKLKFLKMEMKKKEKYVEGAQITSNTEMVLNAIFEPIEKDMKTLFLVFNQSWNQSPDLLPEWYDFLSKLEKKLNKKKDTKR